MQVRSQKFITLFSKFLKHATLIIACISALFPILVIIFNSVKSRIAIFNNPYAIPSASNFDLVGYETVFARSDFLNYYKNSLIVMIVSILIIVIVSTMVAHALAEYNFKLNAFLGIYFLVGLIVPIRLGSVGILKIMTGLHLTNTLWALILIYSAAGLPLAIFILTQFFRQIPRELKEAARIDGAGEWKIYCMCLHLAKPAVASVATLSISPIWNDIWWPLILAPGNDVCTVTMGAQKFLGQFANDWNALLAALTMAMVPIVILYIIFSKSIMSGVVDGAIKG